MKQGSFILMLIVCLFIYGFPAGAAENEERRWQDESVYFLMIDRFNNGDLKNDKNVDMNDQNAYHGGDFQGIIDQLDYIQDMGFTLVALTPVFANEDEGYHGYLVNDFYKPDEHFGSLAKFKKLVNEIHKRNMKIMVDLDVCHIGPNHPWLTDPTKQEWIKKNEAELPALNLENAQVRQYMLKAAVWWMDKTGIDGYRLHSMNDVPLDFWRNLSQVTKQKNADFYLLGDVEASELSQITSYQDAGFDGWLNYPLNTKLKNTFARSDVSIESLFSSLEQTEKAGLDPHVLGNFMDNEQIVRFTNDVIQLNEHPGPRWKQALTFLYTTPGVPIVYYGSEIALDGGEGAANHVQMNFRTDKELADYIAKLGELRTKLPSLTRGTFKVLYEKDGMAVYKRAYKDEISVIAINNTSKTQTIRIPANELKDNKELRGLLNGGLIRSQQSEYMITIDRDFSEIYVLDEITGINLSYILAMSAVLLAFTVFMILVWRKSKANQGSK